MEIPEHLQQEIDDAVNRSLSAELNARGLLLDRATAASARRDAAKSGAALLNRLILQCYPDSRQDGRVTAIEFEGDRAATHVELALAFGMVTANLLMPPLQNDPQQPTSSIELLCAVFNLGIGLIDGLCDGAPQMGLRLLQVLRAMDMLGAARERWPCGRLRSALPPSLAANTTAAFTARVIEAFFDLLHSTYPGDASSTLRRHVGTLLDAALEAEFQSVDRSTIRVVRDQLIECSRRTSVLPLQIIEQLVRADPTPWPTAGTLLGEAMWRIDDLVDLAQDAQLDALNGVLLAAAEEPECEANSGYSALERVLTTKAIPTVAAQAAECLAGGLRTAAGGTAANRDRFVSFIQYYAEITPDPNRRLGP